MKNQENYKEIEAVKIELQKYFLVIKNVFPERDFLIQVLNNLKNIQEGKDYSDSIESFIIGKFNQIDLEDQENFQNYLVTKQAAYYLGQIVCGEHLIIRSALEGIPVEQRSDYCYLINKQINSTLEDIMDKTNEGSVNLVGISQEPSNDLDM